jgi:bifunctional DNase/RNase
VPPRPLTHDLLVTVISSSGQRCCAVISDVLGGTHCAQLEPQIGEQDLLSRLPPRVMESRWRCAAPLFVDADLLSRLETSAPRRRASADSTVVEPGEPIVH